MAHIISREQSTDMRRSPRRESGAVLMIGRGTEGDEARILDLSRTGLRLQSQASCRPGDAFWINAPDHPSIKAKVVWREGDEFGCEFETPISRAVLSAFILCSPIEKAGIDPSPQFTEVRVGKRDDAISISAWVKEFERSASGGTRQIAGFRVDDNDEIIAIIYCPR
ncbi:PilZ domain-containing protein [Novosphingobium album (ex Hu et al. 2023)]|uniref:PilZ domain-containing protein n=1 Tax=Novosphingobium album (ex Hu et al. 2023) TaxID=2930093 RepID=A0ABT0B420_9SPHN|nr:PilZ domain-containing protein [Novosphingobium album (ex Hu et al. 2023)]MCJ2179783.1 PilZ domain-containing protein [Novosphingobium album (ex Hu et al. 2023)]